MRVSGHCEVACALLLGGMLADLVVVEVFVASEFGCFGGGGNPFAHGLDDTSV